MEQAQGFVVLARAGIRTLDVGTPFGRLAQGGAQALEVCEPIEQDMCVRVAGLAQIKEGSASSQVEWIQALIADLDPQWAGLLGMPGEEDLAQDWPEWWLSEPAAGAAVG